MSCSHCSGGYNGEVDTSISSLDFDIGYRASDCEIDDSNNPWWVDVDIDSDRGGKVYLQVELSIRNGKISIDSNDNPQRVDVPAGASNKEANLKISQSTGSNPPNSETIEIDIDWKQRSSGSYSSLTSLSVDRRLSADP